MLSHRKPIATNRGAHSEIAASSRYDRGSAATWRQDRQLPKYARFIAGTILIGAAAPLPLASPAPVPLAPPPTVAGIIDAAPASAWRPIAPDNLLLIDTLRGTMTIELAPAFAPAHVAAIRALVRAGAFTGGAVVRVQDNYVVQFTAKSAVATASGPGTPATGPELPPEYERPRAAVPFTPLPYPDAYAQAGFSDGWRVARDTGSAWLVHCYGMVGVGRDLRPSTGDGSELYAVIGHAPRHLDRNIALVGRVIDGIAPFAALQRGTEAMGFYKTGAEKLPITGARLAADIPGNVRWEVMRTDTPAFAALIDASANRREPFFMRPAGGVDVCNVRIPVRPAVR